MSNIPVLPDSYPELLELLKREIGSARIRAALAVNQELIGLYWRIGREILVRQEREGWGGRVVERLASDLREAFPEVKGFSYTNLKYMRQFASYWPDGHIGPQAVGQLPWGHIRCLLDKLEDKAMSPSETPSVAPAARAARSNRSPTLSRGSHNPNYCLRSQLSS
ncbi:MAG: DUF1016 N-terminal domain-containing protein [Solirubrobacteraceae bacterium]